MAFAFLVEGRSPAKVVVGVGVGGERDGLSMAVSWSSTIRISLLVLLVAAFFTLPVQKVTHISPCSCINRSICCIRDLLHQTQHFHSNRSLTKQSWITIYQLVFCDNFVQEIIEDLLYMSFVNLSTRGVRVMSLFVVKLDYVNNANNLLTDIIK